MEGWLDGWRACLPACRVCVWSPALHPNRLFLAQAPQLAWELRGGAWWGSLVQALQGEGLCGEADVAVTVEPHGQWVPVGHQEPLSQVKLGAKDEQGPLDILLYHPFAILRNYGVALHQLQHLLQVVHAHDA